MEPAKRERNKIKLEMKRRGGKMSTDKLVMHQEETGEVGKRHSCPRTKSMVRHLDLAENVSGHHKT